MFCKISRFDWAISILFHFSDSYTVYTVRSKARTMQTWGSLKASFPHTLYLILHLFAGSPAGSAFKWYPNLSLVAETLVTE
jgi:hypothetical protein